MKLTAKRAPRLPDRNGHFGRFGGRVVPETLMAPLIELEQAYRAARRDPAFQRPLRNLLANYAGRPTPLYFARRLTERCSGARIYLKREDLCHTGAHKINNVLGQKPRRERASTAWPPRPPQRSWGSSARCTWGARTWSGSRSTSFGCGSSARR